MINSIEQDAGDLALTKTLILAHPRDLVELELDKLYEKLKVVLNALAFRDRSPSHKMLSQKQTGLSKWYG